MDGLFDRRLIFVTGKGGVGKSTVAIALGLLAARRGLRTIVAELASQDRIQQTFEQTGETFEEVQLGERLFTISIDPQNAMEEYLKVKTGTVGQMLGSSRLFQAFAMATPGMRELLSIGKVWELAQLAAHGPAARTPYDLVIVDSPAAGHGVGILRTPRTFAEIARVGPIAHQGRHDRRHDRRPRLHRGDRGRHRRGDAGQRDAVAARHAAEDQLPLDAVIVNALYPERFRPADASQAAPRARAGRVARWPAPRCGRRCPSRSGPGVSASSCAGCAAGWRWRPWSSPTCSPRSWDRPSSSSWPTRCRRA